MLITHLVTCVCVPVQKFTTQRNNMATLKQSEEETQLLLEIVQRPDGKKRGGRGSEVMHHISPPPPRPALCVRFLLTASALHYSAFLLYHKRAGTPAQYCNIWYETWPIILIKSFFFIRGVLCSLVYVVLHGGKLEEVWGSGLVD